jgi:hypothetical protein
MEKGEQEKKWEMALMGVYFFIPFYSFRLALENYLFEDRLPMALSLLIGFSSGIIAFVMSYALKDKSLKVKVLWAVALLVAIVLLNLVEFE